MAGGAPVQAQPIIIVDPTQTMQLEHQDRVARLRRVAAELDIDPRPEFHEQVVPARLMPADFPVDTPVLRVVFAERSFFDTDSAALRPEADVILQAIARTLRGDAPDAAVFVAGHTDARGSEAHNYALSVSRADAVAQALYRKGVGAAALWRVGFGEAVPLYPNDDAEHMAFNRRVEFLFSARTAPVLDVLKRQLDHVCVAADTAQSERCKRTIELRPSFEAVQITARRTTLAMTRTAPGATPLSAHGITVATEAHRISIDLSARRIEIPAPTR